MTVCTLRKHIKFSIRWKIFSNENEEEWRSLKAIITRVLESPSVNCVFPSTTKNARHAFVSVLFTAISDWCPPTNHPPMDIMTNDNKTLCMVVPLWTLSVFTVYIFNIRFYFDETAIGGVPFAVIVSFRMLHTYHHHSAHSRRGSGHLLSSFAIFAYLSHVRRDEGYAIHFSKPHPYWFISRSSIISFYSFFSLFISQVFFYLLDCQIGTVLQIGLTAGDDVDTMSFSFVLTSFFTMAVDDDTRIECE